VFGDFALPPRPELRGVGFVLCRGDQLDRRQRLAVLPRGRLFAEGVVDRVLHPPRFEQVADEQVVAVLVAVSLDFDLRECRVVEQAPVAGGCGQLGQSSGGVDVRIMSFAVHFAYDCALLLI